MNRQQVILVALAVAATAGLYFFGSVVGPQKKAEPTANHSDADGHDDHDGHDHATFSIEEYNKEAIAKLSPERQKYISELEANVKRGDVKEQALHANHKLASFWRDTLPDPLLHFNFASRAAELDNSEKSLTFAAHSILGYLPFAQSQQEQSWLAEKGKELFESALKLNPANDSTIVGIGATIIYGASAGKDGPMQGIMKVRDVVQRDSNNLFAQYMLGVGGLVSRQYDKAVLRFEKVVNAQPNNIEALFKLAETYELMGEKNNAANWYQTIASKVKDPGMRSEIEKRIEELRK
jgi:tetratricopeptide (TPR) repeat protein